MADNPLLPAIRTAMASGTPADLATVPLDEEPLGPQSPVIGVPEQPLSQPFPGGDPFRQAYRQVREQQTAVDEQKAGYLKFLHRNPNMEPDQQAEVARLSAATGVPYDVVGENLIDVRHAVEADKLDWHQMVRGNPVLAEFLEDPINHAIVRDSVKEISDLQFWLGNWKSNPLPWQMRLDLATNPFTRGLSAPIIQTDPSAAQGALSESWRQVKYSLLAWKASREQRNPDADPELVELRDSLGQDYGERSRGFLARSVVGTARTLGYMGATLGAGAAGAAGGKSVV